MQHDWRDLEQFGDRTEETFLVLAVLTGVLALLLHWLLR